MDCIAKNNALEEIENRLGRDIQRLTRMRAELDEIAETSLLAFLEIKRLRLGISEQ